MNEIDPIQDTWYSDLQRGLSFQVVEVEAQLVEVQYLDGELDAFDRDEWQLLELEIIAPPEDPLAPYEALDLLDLPEGMLPEAEDDEASGLSTPDGDDGENELE
ncbi:MAG: DUF6763 family protein [Pseudomonadota bacterium]|nr:DUF6763 family protein [Pseudomonadota bacterium]